LYEHERIGHWGKNAQQKRGKPRNGNESQQRCIVKKKSWETAIKVERRRQQGGRWRKERWGGLFDNRSGREVRKGTREGGHEDRNVWIQKRSKRHHPVFKELLHPLSKTGKDLVVKGIIERTQKKKIIGKRTRDQPPTALSRSWIFTLYCFPGE